MKTNKQKDKSEVHISFRGVGQACGYIACAWAGIITGDISWIWGIIVIAVTSGGEQ